MKPSSFVVFVRKIKGKNVNRVTLHRRFRKEVDPKDYEENEVDEIMENLYDITKETWNRTGLSAAV